jgi:hypothetical protein
MLLTAIQEMKMKPNPSTAEWLENQQAFPGLSDQELTEAMGHQAPQVVKLFKSGDMKVPFAKAPQLAHALGINPGSLLQRLLQDADPDLLQAFEECVGPLCLSEGEKKLIGAIRKANPGREPVPVMFDRDVIIAVWVA